MRHLAPALAFVLLAACGDRTTINVNGTTGAGGATSSTTTAGTGGEGGTSSTSTTSTSSSSSSTTTGGTGGDGGGAPECSTAIDCGQDTECSTITCEAGVCGVELVAAGTPCSAGVCLDGACVECAAVADCPDVAVGACEEVACLGGSCGVEPLPYGTPLPDVNPGTCYSPVCDGNGGSIGVWNPNDVPPTPPGTPCMTGACVQPLGPTQVPLPDGTDCLPNHPACPCICMSGMCGTP